jgi:hypothetical protein
MTKHHERFNLSIFDLTLINALLYLRKNATAMQYREMFLRITPLIDLDPFCAYIAMVYRYNSF